jgi:hypothetical protein
MADDIVINDPGRTPEERYADEERERAERENPITADELHRHIQATIFGRPSENAERYDQLNTKLHNIVDTFYGMKKEEA